MNSSAGHETLQVLRPTEAEITEMCKTDGRYQALLDKLSKAVEARKQKDQVRKGEIEKLTKEIEKVDRRIEALRQVRRGIVKERLRMDSLKPDTRAELRIRSQMVERRAALSVKKSKKEFNAGNKLWKQRYKGQAYAFTEEPTDGRVLDKLQNKNGQVHADQLKGEDGAGSSEGGAS